MTRFLVIMAFFDSGDRFRRRNILAALPMWRELFPEADICVAEQNPTGFFAEACPEGVRHIVYNIDGKFNKCRLLNNAVRSNGGYDAYVMADADVFITKALVDYIRTSWNAGSLVFPYGDCIYLRETDTRRIINGDVLTPGPKYHGVIITRQTGLCNVFSRKTFDTIGGFDEAFTGWGAEDDAFVVKCIRKVGPIVRNSDKTAIAYHMFHRAINTDSYIHSDTYIRNRKLCACIRRMTDADLDAYINGKKSMDTLMESYERRGRLEVSLKWHCTREGWLSIDTTIYDIDRSTPITFTKVLEAILAEDGPEYVIEFIHNILYGQIYDLSEEQWQEIHDIETRCACRISHET